MRILESCTNAWPMPDMQAQIQSLREAFSRDVNQPFQLKPSFPYGSPVTRLQPSPPVDAPYNDQNLRLQTTHEQTPNQRYHSSTPITPPISAGHDDNKDGSIAAASLTMMASDQHQQHQLSNSLSSNHMGDDGLSWDPTRIFEYAAKPKKVESRMVSTTANPRRSQWHTAFGTPSSQLSAAASSMTQNSPTMYTPSPVGSHDLPHLHDAMQQPQHFPLLSNMTSTSQMQPLPQPYAVNSHPYVSPSMWQDTVASTYDPSGSLKRRWDMGGSAYGSLNDHNQVKRPR